MSVSGEPLRGRHARAAWASQTARGTAATPNKGVGICEWDLTDDSGNSVVHNIGSPSAIFIKPGLNRVDYTLNITNLQNKDLLALAARTNGTLPYFTLATWFKYDGEVPTYWGKKVQDCKVHNFSLNVEAGGSMRANLSGVGGLITAISSDLAGITEPAEDPIMWYDLLFTKGSSAFEIQAFSLSVAHNVDVDPVILGEAPGPNDPLNTAPRLWKYQTEGDENVTGEITRFVTAGVNYQALTMSDFALSMVSSATAGGGAVTIELSGAKFGSERISAAPGGQVRVVTPFTAKTWSVS